jgi:hypothetical protein
MPMAPQCSWSQHRASLVQCMLLFGKQSILLRASSPKTHARTCITGFFCLAQGGGRGLQSCAFLAQIELLLVWWLNLIVATPPPATSFHHHAGHEICIFTAVDCSSMGGPAGCVLGAQGMSVGPPHKHKDTTLELLLQNAVYRRKHPQKLRWRMKDTLVTFTSADATLSLTLTSNQRV